MRISFTGDLGFNGLESKLPWLREGETKSGSKYQTINISVASAKNNRANVELFENELWKNNDLLKKIVNNPNIPLSEKLKKAQQILGKTKNIQAAEEEFIEEGKYSKLPSESEQAEERAEETKAENQIANAIIEESASKDDSEDNPNANNIASEAKNELDTERLYELNTKLFEDMNLNSFAMQK